MTKINFQEYGINGKKTGTCPRCKKKVVRSIKFYQTQNPFNINKDGQPKSVKEILDECKEKLSAWKKEPTFHAKCE